MIRYRCGNCGKKIRSRQGFAGKRARCPTCSFAHRVPLQSALPQSAPALASRLRPALTEDERESILDEPPLPAATAEDVRDSIFEGPLTERLVPAGEPFVYLCPHCTRPLRAPPTAVGKIGRCPTCNKSSAVPPPTGNSSSHADEAPSSSEASSPAEQEQQKSVARSPSTIGHAQTQSQDRIDLRCPFCTQKWRGPDPAGKPCRCIRCHNHFAPPRTPTAQSAESFVPPTFELIGELGRGAFGVVYVVRHVQLNRVVALKVMRPDVDPELMPRFRAEAQAVARMQHPNIVQIFEVGEHQGRFFCAFEYVDGGSLQEMLHGRPLPSRQAAQLVQELALAMHYAHQQGVVHRDLKPANILFSRKRTTPADPTLNASVALMAGTLKITDFGLAKRLDDDSIQSRAGAVLGTPAYMSPEQAQGKDVGPATDVYSLGAVLYEMLTGKPPFVGKTVYDTLHRVCYDDPVPPRQLDRKIPRDLETICLKCLEKNPARRYASALDLAADLRRFQAGDSIHARPASALMKAVRFVHRQRLQAVALLMLLVAAVGVTWGAWALEEAKKLAQARHAEELLRKQQEENARQLEVAYFTTFVRRRGVAEGLQPITQEQAKKRQVSFRISSRAGRVVACERVNGHSQLTANPGGGTFLEDCAGACRWVFEYRQDGKLDREVAHDRNGNVVWSFVHVNEEIAHFTDARGFVRARHGSAASHVQIRWDSTGLPESTRYSDNHGKPRPDAGRVFGHRYEFDRGLLAAITNLDADGKPALSRQGYARVTLEYDDRGNCKRRSYFGIDGRPCLIAEGYAKQTIEHDDHGNPIAFAHFDDKDRPCLTTRGHSRALHEYDGQGQLIRVSYYDVSNGRCFDRAEGCSSWTARYDERGRPVEYRYFGSDGKPGLEKGNRARIVLAYDERGNVAKTSFYDAEGKPCRGSDGSYGFTATYDERGNRTEVSHFDHQGKACRCHSGYVRSVARYDERDNLIEEAYFDGDGKPILQAGGYAGWTSRFDEQDQPTETAYFGTDGKAVAPGQLGYAKAVWSYDAQMRRIDAAYFDTKDRQLVPQVVVTAVRLKSKGEGLGLKAGDVLVSYEGKPITNRYAFEARRRDEKLPDGARQLVVQRGGKRVVLAVAPGDLEGITLEDHPPEKPEVCFG